MSVRPADGFEALSEYDGCEFVFESGFVARFEIRRTEGEQVPSSSHPYRYSFTLHNPSGKRVLGFDNAHPVSRKSGRRKIRSTSADHWHRDEADKWRPYAFTSPQQLLDDFMKEVERTLKQKAASTEIQEMRKS